MQSFEDIWSDENLIKVLKDNGVAVMPTDTLYGIVGKAENAEVVNRIYTIRKRNPEKSCIILIGDMDELKKFSIILTPEQKNIVENFYTPTSFVLDCPEKKFTYLHRGAKTLAFRVPSPQSLRDLLMKVGPLIAPSANPEGLLPAENISQAKEYFGDSVDLYLDGGSRKGKVSKVIKLHKDGSINILRE